MRRASARLWLPLCLAPSLLSAESQTWTFAVVADPQIGMVEAKRDRENFACVAEAINARKPRLVLIAGDLIDTAGSKPQLDLYEQVKRTFVPSTYAVPGNHDVAREGKRLESALLDGYRARLGPDRFAAEDGGSLFLGLNSQLWTAAGGLPDEQLAWLEARLKDRSRYRHVFVVQHHPLFLSAPDEPDEYFNTPLAWRSRLLRAFEDGRVTAVLTGHLHRQLSASYHGIAMITTPSSCRNFDGSGYGYRLFTVNEDGFTEQYVTVPGTIPEPK